LTTMAAVTASTLRRRSGIDSTVLDRFLVKLYTHN
jgi:hypothetical protein